MILAGIIHNWVIHIVYVYPVFLSIYISVVQFYFMKI